MKRFFLIFVWGDVEPELFGPFDTEEGRDQRAKELRESEGNEHGYYPLEVLGDGEIEVRVGAYSGGFFE